jgi:type II secretion system protein G
MRGPLPFKLLISQSRDAEIFSVHVYACYAPRRLGAAKALGYLHIGAHCRTMCCAAENAKSSVDRNQWEIPTMKALVYTLTLSLIVTMADAAAQAQERMLAHDVYFSLKDNSLQAKQKLIAGCKKYLTDHPGAVRFAVGPRADEIKRGVNDQDFDVALHLVFKSKAAHDQYAKAARHLKFIEENHDNWKKVRVFDSYVEAFANGPAEAAMPERRSPGSLSPPAGQATGLAGRIQAVAAARAEISRLKKALDAYGPDMGGYPTTAQGLRALRTRPEGLAKADDWAGPYLDRDVPLDPWQRPYHYRNPGKHASGGPDIWSLGPDGIDGTADDVGSWTRK